MSENITPEESVAPVYLVEVEVEEADELNLGELEQQRIADRAAATSKLRLLGLTDAEIAAILPQ